jgi:hypothetical protein
MDVVELIASIPSRTEQELYKLLKDEMKGEARPYLMNKLYGRFSILRAQRERVEMAKATAGK